MTRHRPVGWTRMLVAGLLVAACGVEPQRDPQPVPPDRLPSVAPSPSTDLAARGRVWGVREQRLVPVFVDLTATDVAPRVRALLALADAGQGATAIARGTRLVSVDQDGDVVELVLSNGFVRTPERLVPVALAQIVFTVTEVPGVRAARIEADDAPVPLVDSSGRVLTRPLQRADFPAFSDRGAAD